MFIGTNLVGLVIPDLVSHQAMEKLKSESESFIKDEIKKYQHTNKVLTFFFAILILLYIFLLFRLLNIGVAIAAIMLMASRIPDQLWEIEHGTKINKKDMPKGPVYILTTLMSWASLPILWWAFYSLQTTN